ncbi:tripartite tricarboxylate transporter TctB family protein [Elioraea sp.]|uniref:tripartite tricarboxylate transporter TctB family protein n=1 Tax=Elioraea sp. TaxID=2185103 RepID=UPI0025C4BFED|nr:tripartite tricarboxylate transporter TctB family protein [Elioraea sp.]
MRGAAWRVAWGQLALVTALAAFALAYLVDARTVSLSVNNLLLLQPTAILVLFLWGVIAIGCVSRAPAGEASPAPADWRATLRVVGMVAAFGFFILSLERVGYDIAMVLFVSAALWIGGERRPLVLVLFSLIFTAAAIFGFRALVPYPFPTTLI